MASQLLTRQQRTSTHALERERVRPAPPRSPPSVAAFAVPFVQRKPTCPCGGGCPRCEERDLVQAKLRIDQPGDRYEQEADRVAERVMRMPEPAGSPGVSGRAPVEGIQRCEDGGSCGPCADGECSREDEEEERALLQRQPMEEEEEEEEETLQAKAVAGHAPEVTPDVQAEINAVRGGGRPLPQSVRAFFEPRLGYNFGGVRVHTDARAAESARAVSARSFTVGRDIVFAPGQYAPGTAAGRLLLAHELPHTVQQQQAAHDGHIQRACGRRAIGPTPRDCVLVSKTPTGERFLFAVGCDDFAPGEEAKLAAFAKTISPTANIAVLGLASADGLADFNESLSCYRAERGRAVLLREGVSPAQIRSVEATGGILPAHDPTVRAVAIDLTEPLPKCGPDATYWFVQQVNIAMREPALLAIQGDIALADVIARSHGTTAQAVAEGGTAAAVLAQEIRMGAAAAPRDPVILRQLAAGRAAGVVAGLALATYPLDAALIVGLIGLAARAWRALVNHRARYDFKAHVLSSPSTPHCPSPACANTITLCPGSAPANCYLTDLPGNLFYAVIGRFVGWSKLTLQLGSQLAQLTGSEKWDPPQDTAAISLGFSLPLPMTLAALRGSLPPSRSSLTSKAGCEDCRELTTAGFK